MNKKPRRSFMGNYPDKLIHFLRFFHSIFYNYLLVFVIIGSFLGNEVQQFIFTGQFINPLNLFVVRLFIQHLLISVPALFLFLFVWWLGWEAEQEWQLRKTVTWTQKQQEEYVDDVLKNYGKIRLVVDFVTQTLQKSSQDPSAQRDSQDSTVAEMIGLEWKDIMQPLAMMRDPAKVHQKAQGEISESDQQYFQGTAPSTSVLKVIESSREDLKRDNIVALGDPGSGKTTMAYGSMDASAKRKHDVSDACLPVYIPLPELAKALVDTGSSEKALEVVLKEQEAVLKKYPALLAHVVEEITNGVALVYLDSLDEVDGRYRTDLLVWINAMAVKVAERQDSPKGAIIVTTRFTDYRGGDLDMNVFSEWVLQGLEPERQYVLAGKLLPVLQQSLVTIDDGSLSKQERDEISARTMDAQAFIDLIRPATWNMNPMLFSMAAYVYVRHGEFSHTRVVLYNRLINGMIIRRSKDKSSGVVSAKKLIMARLAFILFGIDDHDKQQKQESVEVSQDSHGRVYDEKQLTDLIAQMISDTQIGIAEMMDVLRESGLMTPLSEKRYTFRHQSFQDYLTGVWIATQLMNVDSSIVERMLQEIRNVRSVERWGEPLRYMAGELFAIDPQTLRLHEIHEVGVRWLNEVAEEYRQLNQVGQTEQSLVLLLLLIGSLAEIHDLEEKADSLGHSGTPLELQAYIQLWIDAIATGAGEEMLLRVAKITAGFPQLVQSLAVGQLRALTQQDTAAQTLAAKALGAMNIPQAREALYDLLYRKSASEQARSAAAGGLTQAGNVGCSILRQGLQSDDVELQRIIAGALGAVDKEGTDLLTLALEQQDALTRQKAILSLKNLGQRVPQDIVEKALRDSEKANRDDAISVVALVAVNYPANELMNMVRLLPVGDEQTAAIERIVNEVRKTGQPHKGIALANMAFPLVENIPEPVLAAVARAQKEAGEPEQSIRKTLDRLRQSGADQQYQALLEELIPESAGLSDRLRTLGYQVVQGSYKGKMVKAIAGPMVTIPAGAFQMGSDKNVDKKAVDDEFPQHPVNVADYAIGKYPLTVAEYQQFVEATSREEPNDWRRQLSHPDHPVVAISWYDTLAYVQWLAEVTGQQYRLPTEAEWEKAARGADGRIYPWGNEWDKTKANTDDGGPGGTTPVGSYPQGASPYGCLDMAGNVWEWTSTIYIEKYPYKYDKEHEDLNSTNSRVLRGGSWSNNPRVARAAYRDSSRIVNLYNDRGGRLVRDVLAAGS